MIKLTLNCVTGETMKTIKLFVLALVLSVVAGCASFGTQEDSLQLPITYGTLKVIERDNGINSGDVIEVVNSVEGFLDAEASISGTAIRSYVTTLDEWQELSPADKYLVATLFTSVEETISAQVNTGSLVGNDVRLRVENLLGYIRTAALMY